MKHAKRIEDLLREFGITNASGRWNYDGISWFYDGEHYFTLEREAVGDREWVFDHEFFILLNFALGGQFAGPIGLDTEFPANLYVDYVRVYQQVP